MANDVLSVQSRVTLRKSDISTARRNGVIPGVYYSSGKEAISININERELMTVIASGNVVIDMKLDDAAAHKIVIKEAQTHPVTDRIVHVDLMGIRMDREIEIQIPIHFEGVPEGVKLGGLQLSVLRELTLKGLPGDIPEVIELEIADLNIGDSIHVSDVSIPKVSIVTEDDLAIVSVVTPKVVEEVVEEEVEMEGVEGEEEVTAEGEVPTEEKSKAESDDTPSETE